MPNLEVFVSPLPSAPFVFVVWEALDASLAVSEGEAVWRWGRRLRFARPAEC